MRIVYAANFSLKHCGKYYYDSVLKFQHALIKEGHFTYPFSLNDMERLFSPIGRRGLGLGKKGLNQALIQTCLNVKPDILMLLHGNQIEATTLSEIKKRVPFIRIIFFGVMQCGKDRKLAHL